MDETPQKLRFAHRSEFDGTYVSYCCECFDSVATSNREADLEVAEREHVCEEETPVPRKHESPRSGAKNDPAD